MKPILFIHPRRGLFQLTSCQSCNYKFGCENCDCNLTTYRTYESNMQLLCHQCQRYYNYPKICPKCKSSEIGNNFGGIDELVEILKNDFKKEVIKLESKVIIGYDNDITYVSTRVFDPSIEYNKFSKIIFIHSENLLASPDYLVNEDVHRSLVELFLQIDDTTEVIFDTNNPDLPFFKDLAQLNTHQEEDITFSEDFDNVDDLAVDLESKKDFSDKIDSTTKPNLIDWYTDFIKTESLNREKFLFPPYYNLVLLTTQEKSKEKSLQKINSARQYIFGYKNELEIMSIGSPYQAKFLKRKGMFSHHLLIKFPRQYSQYFELRNIIKSTASTYNLQARLNPRHLF